MLEFHFTPFPVINTERLSLRQQAMVDVPAYFEIRSNDRAMHHLARPQSQNEDDARAVIQGQLFTIKRIEHFLFRT
jgi:ribosomal-protein-alanine N-acetyltransferase